MILDIITSLNKQKHGEKATFASLERALGICNGSIKKWQDHTPKLETLLLIADHFNVSLDYLCERKSVLSNDEIELLRYYREMNKDGRFAALMSVKGFSEQDVYKKRDDVPKSESE